MAAMVGKYAANKMLRGQMAKYQSKKPCGDQVSESHTGYTPSVFVLAM